MRPNDQELEVLGRNHKGGSRRRRMTSRVAAVLTAAILAATASSAAGALVPIPPANTDCRGDAVITKLSVVEDRAAANMLAEATRAISGSGRCLLDAGDPATNRVPSGTRRDAAMANRVFVVGGPAAIPDSWLSGTLGVSDAIRLGGGNRWATQAAVALAIIDLTQGRPVVEYTGEASSAAVRPPNTDCTTGAVIAKLGVVEDTAAGNMLAETLSQLSAFISRCLVDAGDTGAGLRPSATSKSEVGLASKYYVVGGQRAIPDEWLRQEFGLSPMEIAELERFDGSDRWETQAQIAAAIWRVANSAWLGQNEGPGSTSNGETDVED